MKVNKAPEKIYIQPDAQDCWFMVNNLNNTLIEYIRTDAFIEKAAKWVKERAELFLLKTPICDYYDYKKAVYDFRKYMEDSL